MTERERFSPSELAVVLSHFDLGIIQSAKELHRGSRRSPKLLIQTGRGRYLLKRRARGRDDHARVRYAHQLIEHLRRKRVPTPALMLTRSGESVLELGGHVYELFEYRAGNAYDGSLRETTHAGATLGRFHRAVEDFEPGWTPPPSTFHDSNAVRAGLNSIPSNIESHDSVTGHEAELLSITQELHERYDEAAEAVNQVGFASWPAHTIHGDWHPGNMRFRDGRVCVVLDFDAVRRQPRVIDAANGLLQFSVLRGVGDPENWPDFLDLTRLRRFILGYGLIQSLSTEERLAIPSLMIESLIAECAVPIAVTGSFGAIPGFGVLVMARRKVRWMVSERERIQARLSAA